MVGDIRLWIAVPVSLMVVLSIALWFTYSEHQHSISTIDEPQVATLWGYIQSDTFKAIITLLFIPIFMFLFERRFKILENYEASIREKAAQRIKENREKRLAAIEHTLSAWNSLYKTTTAIAYCRISTNNITNIPSIIDELLEKLEVFSNETEDIVNEWEYRFPNLTKEDARLLVNFINNLLQPARSIARFIKDEIQKNQPNLQEIKELQMSLIVIAGSIKAMYHHSLISTLKDSTELLRIIEDSIPEHDVILTGSSKIEELIALLPDKEKTEVERIRATISDRLKLLRRNDKNIFHAFFSKRQVLPAANRIDTSAEEYQSAYDDAKMILKDSSLESYFKSESWDRFRQAYNAIPLEVHLKNYFCRFTREDMKNFVIWCHSNAVLWQAEDDASYSKDEVSYDELQAPKDFTETIRKH